MRSLKRRRGKDSSIQYRKSKTQNQHQPMGVYRHLGAQTQNLIRHGQTFLIQNVLTPALELLPQD